MQKKKLSVVPPGAAPDAPPRVDAEVPAKAKRRFFTADYKKRILAEADAATEPGAIGALLRREGLYSSHLLAPGARRRHRAGVLQEARPQDPPQRHGGGEYQTAPSE